eukprot:g3014.t1
MATTPTQGGQPNLNESQEVDEDLRAEGRRTPESGTAIDNDGRESIGDDEEFDNNRCVSSSTKREIGVEAVWSLSTAKPGNGVDQLRDDNVDTYWQSDGTQPHFVNIQFQKKMSIHEIAFYLDHKMDESYTPKKISVKAGNTFHDLEEVYLLDLEEPNGWVTIDLKQEALRTHLLQVAVLAMHQNGRDTHIRQMKVFGPRLSVTRTKHMPEFKSLDFTMFSCIR